MAGHRVFAPSLTGLSDRAHLFAASVSLGTHVEDIVNLVACERIEDCILVGHSYGGNVITGVADRLRERVAQYVYLDAVAPPDEAVSWCWADFSSPAERAERIHAIETQGNGLCLPPPAPAVFGIVDPEMAADVAARLTPMPRGTFEGRIALLAGGSRGLPRTYIAAAAPAYPRMASVIERVRQDPGWRFGEIACGHDAMLLAPRDLADRLLAIAAEAGA